MNDASKTSRSRLGSYWYVPIALGFGFVGSLALGGALHRQIDPHAWLRENEVNRLYVAGGCVPSERAVAYLRDSQLEEDFVVVPIDTVPGPERDALCAAALQRIAAREAKWWLWLPKSYLCERLSTEAWNWNIAVFEQKSPGLVVAGEAMEPGFGEPHVARLETINGSAR